MTPKELNYTASLVARGLVMNNPTKRTLEHLAGPHSERIIYLVWKRSRLNARVALAIPEANTNGSQHPPEDSQGAGHLRRRYQSSLQNNLTRRELQSEKNDPAGLLLPGLVFVVGLTLTDLPARGV
jgi:hypothetical protein